MADRTRPDAMAGGNDVVAVDNYAARKPAMHRIVAQQMRIGLDRPEIVERHDFDIASSTLHDGAQHEASDASKAVDRNAYCHSLSLRHARAASEAVDCISVSTHPATL